MKVEKITAAIRYSQDTGHGAWKALEISAEASLAAGEVWQKAQTQLYAELTKEFKALWSANGVAPHVPEAPQAPAAPPERSHWCAEHQAEFKARTGPHGEFYSHQIKGTREWCNEPKGAA